MFMLLFLNINADENWEYLMANILIVEDNLMNFEMAKELLQNIGHNVIKAENANEGLDLAKFKNPDLILMDLSLPGIDGLTATKMLKQDSLTKDIPVIAFTALVMQSDKEKAFGAGCSGFISKPIDINTFPQIVNDFLKDEKKINNENHSKKNITRDCFKDNAGNIDNYKFKWHKILIIDDNPMNTDLLKDLLAQINQSTTVAYSGKKALEIVENETFDLILLDIMMPEMSGFEVLKNLKLNSKTKDIPVIFISALNEIPTIVKGLDLGSYDYITKPYSIEEVKARILNILRIKDLQDELRTEKNKLDLIFKFSADAVVMLNVAFEIISCNDRFLEWFNVEKEDIINKKICSALKGLFTKEICPLYNSQILEKINAEGFVQEFYIENTLKNRVIEIKYSTIKNNNKPEGYVLVCRDITLDKEIEIQKETFVATLTHDLKTPIRAEMRALELLLNNNFGELNDQQADIIKDTLYSSKFMFSMVDNILSTYKYENGKIILNKDNIDINGIIKTCCNEQKHIINDKKLDLVMDFADEKALIYADPIEIKRVIMNLLSNAVSYTDNNGRIIIKSYTANNKLTVSFIDSGRGISEEDILKIFEKYTSYAKKFKQVGTGLGLYLTKQIVEMHEGNIFAESRLNKGSTFTFSIPV